MSASGASRIAYDVFALADIQQEKYQALADRVNERMTQFKCERSPHLQNFARTSVRKYEAHGHSRTYVMITAADDTIDVAGFFTVGMTALNFSQASATARKKLMGDISREQTGAYSIAELARSDDFSSKQLPGSTILDEAKEVIKRARNYVAGRFLVVDARPEVFERLYRPAGFRQIDVATPPRDMQDVEFITACAVIKDW
ncbi:hypothetical protein [Microbacterium sp. SD291]|uniref:hypothetical protein n=1 Tax=Microbacterium sp. SD291 TaxID=2782007 RepID=UPI001A958C48|nr:hypothetical protein [Microbacterium sp. SD291]MBO0979908.1 hypothetical protein [Microbacterium sp. SD291]